MYASLVASPLALALVANAIVFTDPNPKSLISRDGMFDLNWKLDDKDDFKQFNVSYIINGTTTAMPLSVTAVNADGNYGGVPIKFAGSAFMVKNPYSDFTIVAKTTVKGVDKVVGKSEPFRVFTSAAALNSSGFTGLTDDEIKRDKGTPVEEPEPEPTEKPTSTKNTAPEETTKTAKKSGASALNYGATTLALGFAATLFAAVY